MIRGLLGRVSRLEKAKPAVSALDWGALSGEREPPDLSAEVVPGCGFTWAEATEPTAITDPVDSLVAGLPRTPKPASPPEEPPALVPALDAVCFPAGYEPGPHDGRADDEPDEPEPGDDDAD